MILLYQLLITFFGGSMYVLLTMKIRERVRLRIGLFCAVILSLQALWWQTLQPLFTLQWVWYLINGIITFIFGGLLLWLIVNHIKTRAEIEPDFPTCPETMYWDAALEKCRSLTKDEP